MSKLMMGFMRKHANTPEQLYAWLTKHVQYQGVPKEILYTPEDVLIRKQAHCWESSSLEFDTLEQLGLQPSILYLEAEKDTLTHTTVYYTDREKFYWCRWHNDQPVVIQNYPTESAVLKAIIATFRKEYKLTLVTRGGTPITENTKQLAYYHQLRSWYKLDMNNPVDPRGYRQGVRIVITRGDLLLLGQRYKGKELQYYLFPGGGVEKGETLEQAVIKECLEEVGILVKNMQLLGITRRSNVDFIKGNRAKHYRGGEDIYVTAEFVRMDSSIYGADKDNFSYTWENCDSAIRLLDNGPENRNNAMRYEAIEKVRTLKLTKKKVGLESW